jgi:chemotaxis protein methyltransferase CheR
VRPDEIEDLEIAVLIDTVRQRWGFDLASYGQASLRRRIAHATEVFGVGHPSALIPRLLHDEAFYPRFLSCIAVSLTEFFRDPALFAALRDHVLPVLATYPRIRIWHAGCASGEEVYSMAILLREAQLLERSHLYATDINTSALDVARAGVYSCAQIDQAEAAYVRAGGRGAFRDHCIVRDGHDADRGILVHELRERITWAVHNLCTDGVFTEANLIMCRNTLIYFARPLQDRVAALLLRSLVPRGFLALGDKETLEFSASRAACEVLDARNRIYRAGVAAAEQQVHA